MQSLWQETVNIPERGQAEGILEREIVVIGGGMTGILTAWLLQREGKQVIVLEAQRIAGGQTGRTTAKITSQHGMFYSELLRRLGRERTALYAGANQEAIEEYARIVKEREIDCDFRRLPSYLYSTENETMLRQEAQAARMLGVEADFTEIKELPFSTAGAVCFHNQAQFHPLKFLRTLVADLEIYENSMVRSVHENIIYTEQAEIRAKQIVFATHYPIIDFPGFYFLRQHQERSYVLGLADCEPLEGMYYSADENGLSFRSAGRVLLLGGNSHRTGQKRQGSAYASLKAAACKYYPGVEIRYQWSAQDCMPHDELPFIGQYSPGKKDWYVATGYKKWGMTSAMVAAGLLRDMICGKENSQTALYTPQRKHLYAAPKLAVDLGESTRGLLKGVFAPVKKREEKRNEVCLRCAHMGCRLEWNPDEKSWDCPCHGSRFSEDGSLLDEPAQKPLHRKSPES